MAIISKRGRRLRNLAHFLRARVRHPRRVTCLQCGFLSLGDAEVTAAQRTMLHLRSQNGIANLNCARSRWESYDLEYSGPDAEGIFNELEVDRRSCQEFLLYRPGWTPNGHKEILLKKLETQQKILFAVLGSLLTLFAAWVTKKLSGP